MIVNSSCAVPLLLAAWPLAVSSNVNVEPPGRLFGSRMSCGYDGLLARVLASVTGSPSAFVHVDGETVHEKSAVHAPLG